MAKEQETTLEQRAAARIARSLEVARQRSRRPSGTVAHVNRTRRDTDARTPEEREARLAELKSAARFFQERQPPQSTGGDAVVVGSASAHNPAALPPRGTVEWGQALMAQQAAAAPRQAPTASAPMCCPNCGTTMEPGAAE